MATRKVSTLRPKPGPASSPDLASNEPPVPPHTPPFLVAAVGASAGGLEAFSRMLDPITRETRLAIVLVQHLARDQRSLLSELLARKTRLEVVDAEDGLAIKPGHVYVIRPDTLVRVVDGALRVLPQPANAAKATTINDLFDSLAEQYREKAVGVILSGGGHDGVTGLLKIKAAGGITLSQEPGEAQVSSMPLAAIEAGAIDLVLTAEGIAAELVRLSEHPFYRLQLPIPSDEAPSIVRDEDHLRSIFQLLRRNTGVDFTEYKSGTIHRRLQRRMALHRMKELPAYLAFLEKNPAEVQQLHDDILIHVTSFFRDRESFDALASLVVPEIAASHGGYEPVRAWVPGCSSGEEAYSLAITLIKVLDRQSPPLQLQIFGTDVSQTMIDKARAGFYPDSVASELTPDELMRFFTKVEGGYRVNADLRERCVFARQDVGRDPPFSKLDIVLCRNLLIYLGQPLQRKIISVFHYALNPGGFLVLGRSETIGQQAEFFTVVDGRWKIHKRKPGMIAPGGIEFSARAQPPSLPGTAPTTPRHTPRGPVEWDVQGEANRLLLDRFSPPVIIVDDEFRIVRSRGSTSAYVELPSGEATLDVLKMARPGLWAPLKRALTEAREHNAAVKVEGSTFTSDRMAHKVHLEVTPLGQPGRRHFLILFEEVATDAPASSSAERPGRPPASDRAAQELAVEQLQDELSSTRAHLQSMIQDLEAANEELQSANEEILSSNEELQSTNEELDTAREELQSTNEELSTVNDELQTRNSELSRSNSDLVNLLANVHIPIVMISSDLKIRSFTPAAERTLNLIASDIGRPIGHIKPNIRCPELESLIREVNDTMAICEREVDDPEGNSYMLTIRPYKTVNNRIDGTVLALLSISSSLKIARDTGEAIMSTVRDPILLLSSDQKVQRANRAFYDKFAVSPREVEGRCVFDLGDGQWNIPGLRTLLRDILPDRKNFEGFLVEHQFPSIGHQRFLLDGRRIESGRWGEGVILLIMRDAVNAQA